MTFYGSAHTNIMTEALKHACKPLKRDYGEIMHLQSSHKGTKIFTDKAYIRVENIIRKQISLQDNSKIFIAGEKMDDNCHHRWIINPICGKQNFAHALPFFCTSISLEQKVGKQFRTISAVVEVPAMEEIYFAELGKGAWVENYSRFSRGRVRIRTSARTKTEEILISSNQKNNCYNAYGAGLLEMIFVAAGKIDACILDLKGFNNFAISSLFIQEAGGFISQYQNNVIAANPKLHPIITSGVHQ